MAAGSSTVLGLPSRGASCPSAGLRARHGAARVCRYGAAAAPAPQQAAALLPQQHAEHRRSRSHQAPVAACAALALAPVPGRRRLNRRCLAHPRRGPLVCLALSLPDAVDTTLRNIVTISAAVGISYAVLLAAVSVPPPPPPAPGSDAAGRRAVGPGVSGSDDNFVWGLMGFISCLPLFGWLAWALAAISDEDRAALYGTYAALYGAPLLLRGLDWQDPWALLMLALCVAHVQASARGAERIARTEPETLCALRPIAAVGAAVRGAVGGTGKLLAGVGGVLREDAKRADARRPGGRGLDIRGALRPGDERLQLGQDPRLDSESKAGTAGSQEAGSTADPRRDPSREPELEDFSVRELRQFDEQLKQRGRQQQERGNSKGQGP
ncbi:hypothetical protein TSOC_010228 [Tetrabaena socialis]|uniref:Uncharacterized protein n=1 Tax=Tetrabaena socialis TaxID=47790 RepID=A0A2J7ZTV3_9CHLO|nr:hypothetical protein TSOC_010228 [Tetrabaena socialis]|eukprot:PNH03706.1 hypothetical protein TSOC_010228 [Tetrabaena socialis]